MPSCPIGRRLILISRLCKQRSALMSNQSTVNVPTSSSTNTAAATITTQVGAAVGSHSLSVTQLAQAQEVVSASQSSGTTALGLSGSFTLNGKTIQINSGDALQDVAAKINAAGTGATANVVTVGTNDYRLTLTSTQTGVANSLAASDTGGTVLGSLGLIQSGAASVRQSVSYAQGGTTYTTGAGSLTLASASQAVGTQLGIAAGSAPSGTFHLSNGSTGSGNEADIAVNLNTDSLSSIANAINQAGISGISAEVVTVPDANGNLNRLQQLRIVSSSSAAPTFTDTSGALSTLGVLQNPYTNTIAPAQDAKVYFGRPRADPLHNTLNDVITGATVSLLSGTAATPATTTLSITQNTQAVVQAVSAFATAYNAVQDFVTNETSSPRLRPLPAARPAPARRCSGTNTLTQISRLCRRR